MASQTYKRKKRANYRRNQRLKARLIAEGMTPEEAQAEIAARGQAQNDLQVLRDRADAPAWAALQYRGELQPKVPQSVRAIPAGAFDTNRRRH